MQFMTEAGVDLKLVPVSPALIERVVAQVEHDLAEAEGLDFTTPTYQLRTVAGELQTFELTAEMLDPPDPEEAQVRKAKWHAYTKAQTRLALAQAEARMRFMLTWGVEFEMPKDDHWQKIVKKAGVEIPTDEDDLRFTYLWYVLLTPIEVQRLFAELQIVAYGKAVDQKDIDSFRKGLRDSVRIRARQAIERAISISLEGTTEGEPDTDLQLDAAEGGPGGEVMGEDA